MSSIQNTENEIVEEFSFFPEWTDKYQYIIELGHKLNNFPKDKMTEEYKIKGCQSSVWLTAEMKDGKIYFNSDSDSSIVKGLAALMINILSGRTPEEIINAKLGFIDKIGLRQHLAPTRSNGLSAMIKQMKMYALAYKIKLEGNSSNGNGNPKLKNEYKIK
ncbi:MAG: SufE family protein [Ignavibacteriae bacterium]|nr:MAG: SufE family protein [Ignavibacteriota bacterium]